MKHLDTRLLKEIQSTQFAVLEMALYLNTHPNDENALQKHNELVRELMGLENEYINNYGPLTIECARFDYPWSWIDEPWPWQINY